MSDYPAAHSMDSTWFAVDEDGQVAVFETDEGGCLPEGGFPLGGESGGYSKKALEDFEFLARVLMARAESDPRLGELLPDEVPVLEAAIEDQGSWDLVTPLLRSLGVWTYGGPVGSATPYVQLGPVPRPIELGELDEVTRNRFMKAKLPLKFREMPILAPGEYVPVRAWDCFWFDREGRAHPAAGGEEAFARMADELKQVEEDDDWRIEAEDGPIFEGDALYAAVQELVGDPEDWTRLSPPGVSWWRRVLRLG